LFARTATPNLFLPKGNRLFIRKKALKMNPRDARNVDVPENSRETAAETTITTDGKKSGEPNGAVQ